MPIPKQAVALTCFSSQYHLARPNTCFQSDGLAARMLQTSIETALLDRPDAVTNIQTCVPWLQAHLQVIHASVVKEPPAYGLIHGNVIRANALVGGDATVTVLDFDFCGRGWRAYDIASYLLTIRGTPNEREFADALLARYIKTWPLLPAEHAAIPLFEVVRTIFEIGTPARYVNHWGSAYLYAFLDQS